MIGNNCQNNLEEAREHDHDSHTRAHHHPGRHKLDHTRGIRARLSFFHGHSHGAVRSDVALEASDLGIWAVKISFVGLFLTTVIQLIVFLISNSAGLLADTVHNGADALTTVPLWIAFAVGRRRPTERYTYGYGRAEDVAGLIVVLIVAASGLVAAYQSVEKLLQIASSPGTTNLIWVAVAATVGCLGNEAVAVFRIKVGNEIGSAALIADGQHAKADGLTSLAVLAGVLGVWLGFPLADPIVGLFISIAVLFIVKDTALAMWHRIMDAVDPQIVGRIKNTASGVSGVQSVHDLRVRWLGHSLETEMHITVDEDLLTKESHRIAEEVRHRLFHEQAMLSEINIHVDPCGHGGADAHELTTHRKMRSV
jgi:cation diffusion facilitator family transporter